MKYLLTICYNGAAYCGYQVQPNGVTVQEMLNKAAEALFGYPCDVVGCSRTDSGVHARGFCATVSKKGENDLQTAIPAARVPRAMNAHLPQDIAVLAAREVSSDFHARYGVESKEYEYLIYNGRERNPFFEGRAWHIPTPIDDATLARMQEAAAHFVGKQDFSAFMAQGSQVESTVRNVVYADVTRDGDIITFKVAADGFLYNMVRIMAGTLISVGLGKIDPADIPEIILSCNRERAGMTAAAHGLYLNKVIY